MCFETNGSEELKILYIAKYYASFPKTLFIFSGQFSVFMANFHQH